LTAVDGSVVETLARVARLSWLPKAKGASLCGYRLHTQFEVLRGVPSRIDVTPAKPKGEDDERAVLARTVEPDRMYMMDRGYAQFSLWNAIVAKKSSYCCRIRDNPSYDVERAMELTEADRTAGVVSDEVVLFGRSKAQTTPDHAVRIVTVKATPHRSGGKTGGGIPASQDCNKAATIQVDTYTRANAALKSEQSKQFSVGAVWDVLPAISVKADYAKIKIDDRITLIGAQDLIRRSNGTDPRAIPAGLAVIRNSTGAIDRVNMGYANEGTLQGEYLDASITGRWRSATWGNFDHELRYSNTLSYDDDGNELRGTLGLPHYRATLSNNWKLGAFGVSYNLNVTGRNYDDPETPVGTYVTHDIQGTWSTPWGGKLAVGLVNAFDKMPSLVPYDGRNFNFYLYDAYGRQAYVRLEQKF
jgi:hypothetical protein